MLDQQKAGLVAAGIAGLLVTAALAVPSALARQSSPRIVGNAAAGKPIFAANCGSCHRLEAAGSEGRIGPDLDRLSLSEATIVKQVTDGGPALMGRAAAKYAIQMVGYRGVLTTVQIDDVAAFVYTVEHP